MFSWLSRYVRKVAPLGVELKQQEIAQIPLIAHKPPNDPKTVVLTPASAKFVIHNVEQRSREWFELRKGLPTASQFCKIITSRGTASKQAESYLATLLAEISGHENEYRSFGGSYWTERGTELEEEAVGCYERDSNIRTVKVGFITDHHCTIGCSPDRLVGTDGLLEVKCPAPHTHQHYLRKQRMDARYYPQVQGQLLITGRSWVDFFSYDPDQPHFKTRVFRDEPYITTLRELLRKFVTELRRRQT